MISEKILLLMFVVGIIIFMSAGFCVANSIESKESKSVSDTLTAISIFGIFLFLVGFFGLFINYLIK